MKLASLGVVIGWLAVGVGLGSTWIQFRRLRRRGLEGVSLATWTLFVLMGLFWMTYGAWRHSWEIFVGSAVILPLQVAIVVRLSPWRHWRTLTRALGYFVVLCVTPTLVWGWFGGLLGTGAAMTLNRVPQIVELVRRDDARGVSAASWAWGATGSLLWVTYYASAHLWGAFIATGFAGAASVVIAVLAAWRHRNRRSRQFELAYEPATP